MILISAYGRISCKRREKPGSLSMPIACNIDLFETVPQGRHIEVASNVASKFGTMIVPSSSCAPSIVVQRDSSLQKPMFASAPPTECDPKHESAPSRQYHSKHPNTHKLYQLPHTTMSAVQHVFNYPRATGQYHLATSNARHPPHEAR